MSDATREYGDELAKRSIWELYRMADCFQPDGPDSPGNRFLDAVRDDCAEHIRTDDMTPETLRDKASELANQAVYDVESRGTYRKWLTFTDLGAWMEDLSETGWGCDGKQDDLSQGAGVALHMIAERLVLTVAQEWEQALSDAAH